MVAKWVGDWYCGLIALLHPVCARLVAPPSLKMRWGGGGCFDRKIKGFDTHRRSVMVVDCAHVLRVTVSRSQAWISQ